MRVFILLIYFGIPFYMMGQSPESSLRLKVKSNVYNHFSAFISNMNQEKGDREKYLSLFNSEDVNFIDDELTLTNHNYAGDISIGAFQEKVTNRTSADLSDEDWCGMPFYVGEPIFNDGDSTGEIDIVIKRVLQNTKDRPFPLTDTQILVVSFNFVKTVTTTDEDKVITKFQFSISNVALHPNYKKPHYVEIDQEFSFKSFGKTAKTTVKITPDSIKINGHLVDGNFNFFNNKDKQLVSETNRLNIVSYKENTSYSQKKELNENLIFESFNFNLEKRLGEMGLSVFGNGGSGLAGNAGKFLNGPFKSGDYNIVQSGFSLDLHFPFLKKAPKKLSSKNETPNSGNLSFINLGAGIINTGTFLGFNNISDNQARIDAYGNDYNRIATYKSFTERQKENAVLLSLGLEKRNFLSKQGDNFLKLGATLVGTIPISLQSTTHTLVNYAGYYPDYFNITLYENGIMDYGDYAFTKESSFKDFSNRYSIAAKGYLGFGFKTKNLIIQPQIYYWHQINKPIPNGNNPNLGADYGSFSSIIELNSIGLRRLLGLEMGFFILL